MRIEGATITTLFTMAVECKTRTVIPYLRDGSILRNHLFDAGDKFLVTVFIQMRMKEHSAANEVIGEVGEFEFSADFIEWQIASATYKRNDGAVHIPIEQFKNFRFVRAYNDSDTPLDRRTHLCGVQCWYGTTCKTPDLARTPEEVEAISF